MKRIFGILLLFFSISSFSQASLIKLKLFGIDTIPLNGIVLFQTVKFYFSDADSAIEWGIDYPTNSIILSKMPIDTFLLEYRVSSLSQFFHKKADTVLLVPKMKDYQTNENNSVNVTETDIIQKGYLQRGFSAGNNRDLVLNSKMNLNLEGKLSDDLRIKAKLNDEHIPVQPDGNTANIKDIDEINIKIYDQKNSIEAGDIMLQQNFNFLKYSRKINGIYFKSSRDTNNYFDIGFASNKGTFSRQKITAIDNVQGPYKLNGNNGETFIIILPETEKVYLDGKLLKRGEDNDYTIDYNTAEIKFTTKNIITEQSRIIVEFEYRERNYASFSIVADKGFKIGKNNFYAGFYQKKDAINQTIDLKLNDTVADVLSKVGDNLNNALMLNVDSVPYDERKILYEKIDTTINNVSYTIYKYSTNLLLAHFDVHFAYKGANKGDYVLLQSNVNGRIYKWVAPKNGVHQGEYSPYTNLVSPKQHIMTEFGGDIALSSTDKLSFAFASSNEDLNILSKLDDNDNLGLASSIAYSKVLKADDSLLKTFSFDYSFISQNFVAIDRFDSPEFERDWNIDTAFHLIRNNFGANLKKLSNRVDYNIGAYVLNFGNDYFGIKPFVDFERKGEKINLSTNVSFLSTKTITRQSIFLRSKSFIEFHNHYLKTGAEYEQELNKILLTSNKLLLPESDKFNSYSLYLKSPDNLNFNYELIYKKRFDYYIDKSMYKISTNSDNIYFNAGFNSENYKATAIVNYRIVAYIDSLSGDFLRKKNLNSSLNIGTRMFKKSMSLNLDLGIITGMEPQMQFVFIEVEPSKGNYTWHDFNNDSIKQIDEFLPAFYSDQANYRKIAIQTNKYVLVLDKKLTVGSTFRPANLFENETFASRLASKFYNTCYLQLNNKSYNRQIFDYSSDSSLNYLWTINNTSSLMISDKITISYIFENLLQTQFLTAGNEKEGLHSDKLVFTFKNKLFEFQNTLQKSLNSSRADYSIIKNYDIYSLKYEGEIRIEKKKIDFVLIYDYNEKNTENNDNQLYANKLSFVNNFKINAQTGVQAEIDIINNKFQGNESGNVAYIMMDGLQNGLNLTWQFSIKRKINKYMSFNFEYNGRKSENSRFIHNGSVNLIAIF